MQATESSAPTAATPRQNLARVARGEVQLRPADLTSVLSDHLLALDRSAKTLTDRCDGLIEMMFAEDGGGADPAATLAVVAKLDRLRRAAVADLQKTAAMLNHIASPRGPGITVVAAAQAVTTNEPSNTRPPVDLGASRGPRP